MTSAIGVLVALVSTCCLVSAGTVGRSMLDLVDREEERNLLKLSGVSEENEVMNSFPVQDANLGVRAYTLTLQDQDPSKLWALNLDDTNLPREGDSAENMVDVDEEHWKTKREVSEEGRAELDDEEEKEELETSQHAESEADQRDTLEAEEVEHVMEEEVEHVIEKRDALDDGGERQIRDLLREVDDDETEEVEHVIEKRDALDDAAEQQILDLLRQDVDEDVEETELSVEIRK